jgi:L-seryl-tRNA(Ser) seleniumtransferase
VPYQKSEFLEALGVRSIINADNWCTAIVGGSVVPQAVLDVICDVERVYCNIDELMAKCCARIAHLCDVRGAFITSGAAAGIALCTAACITGKDTAKMKQLVGILPRPANFRNEVIMQKGVSSGYDYQFWQAGARLVLVGYAMGTALRDVADAVSARTAAIAHTHSYHSAVGRTELPVDALIDLAHRHDLPMYIDSASLLPPRRAVHRFADLGADLTIFSGGKAIRAPNDTGLILAGTDRGVELIEAIRMQAFPHDGIGRPFKVSKGQIAGLTKAVELFMAQDEQVEYAKLMAKAEWMAEELTRVPGVTVTIIPNDDQRYEHPISAHVPKVLMEWDAATLGITAPALTRVLLDGDPPISVRTPRIVGVHTSKAQRTLDTYFLQEGEARIVVDRVREALTRKRRG